MKRFVVIALTFLMGCSPYSVRSFLSPFDKLPETFAGNIEELEGKDALAEAVQSKWWLQFEDETLHQLIDEAMANNLTLRAAWSRLRQAEQQARKSRGDKYPQLDISAGASRHRSRDLEIISGVKTSGDTPVDNTVQNGTSYGNSFFVRNGLSYELDLWKRISSLSEAELFRTQATRADMENTALVLSGNIAQLWFHVREQQALLDLLEEQVEVGETFLELTNLRFAVGKGSALDILQQRQLLAGTKAEVPRAQAELERTLNQLATLLGQPDDKDRPQFSDLPALPPFPKLISPADLLDLRPDLRAAQLRLQGSEYDVAAAVAERFPRLNVGLSYEFRAAEISDIFTPQVGTLVGETILPIIDGAKRRAQVFQREARVDELFANYGQLYLTALEDVENAIVSEFYQKELIVLLDDQIKAATATLEESRSRYSNGLSDYLQVILSVQTLQTLQRRKISEQQNLLIARTRLYLALGGNWTKELTTDEEVAL